MESLILTFLTLANGRNFNVYVLSLNLRKRYSLLLQIKRFSKSHVYVKNTLEENAISNDILKLPNGLLELEKPFKLFDMKKFQQNVNREMKRTYPDRRKLENQCISAIAFVRNEQELLDSPIWIMLINIVALEMLRVKLPAGKSKRFNDALPLSDVIQCQYLHARNQNPS